MSYDLYLRDPVTREELEVPAHMMYGGNILCKEIDGVLVPAATTEAYLNITYNYANYYYGAFPSEASDPGRFEADRAVYGLKGTKGGIRALEGLTGLDAVPVLEEMIRRIEEKYKDEDGWISTERKKTWYASRIIPGAEKDENEMLLELLRLKREGLGDEEAARRLGDEWEKKESVVSVSEGETGDYWLPTAANAIRPLHQLIALSRMRPDGVWSEES